MVTAPSGLLPKKCIRYSSFVTFWRYQAFADSMTELKPVTSDLDVRYATSSSEYSDPTQLSTAPNATLEDLGITADDSAQQLSDYFKLREQTSNFSSSSDGSFIMAEEGRVRKREPKEGGTRVLFIQRQISSSPFSLSRHPPPSIFSLSRFPCRQSSRVLIL